MKSFRITRRTVIFPTHLTKEEAASLLTTLDLYAKAVDYFVNIAWSMDDLTIRKLHDQAYDNVRKTLNLKSQYTCSSRDKAFESVCSAKSLMRCGQKVSKPSVQTTTIRLDARTLSFDKKMETASVATQDKRIKIPLKKHKHAKKYVGWNCKAGEIGINKKGQWVLRLVFEKVVEKPQRTGRVFGADRGIKHPVVVSNNKFYGEGRWNECERKHRSHISRLQAKGTKSAKRHLKKASGRWRRFRTDCDRVIVSKIFKDIKPGDTIVLENLTHIKKRCGTKGKVRKKHRAKMGRWSFRRLEDAFNYKAEVEEVYIETVDARYTSQTCSRCNKILKSNRKSQSLYSCACGLKLNADLNAARNIAKKWCLANG
jgi:putative transposase